MPLNLLSKTACVAGVVLSALSLTVPPAFANRYNYWVTNRSSHDIVEFYVSESWSNNWYQDITGLGVLRSGSSLQVIFGHPSQCLYDFRAIFADGQVLERYEVNVCSNGTYGEFTYYD